MKPIIATNTLLAIEARRLGVNGRRMKNIYRYNMRIMKKLLMCPNWVFTPVLSHRGQGTPVFLWWEFLDELNVFL